MKILITGATGLIGSRLAIHLADSGQEVHALYRSEAKAEMLKHPKIRLFKGSVEDVESIRAAVAGCSQVYHLAAFTGVWHRDRGHYRKINVESTVRLLDEAARAGIEAVVVTSTAGVLGPSPGVMATDELSEKRSGFFTYYEESKWIMEEMARDYQGEGMRIVIVNPTRLYGPGILNASNSVTKLIVQFISGKWRFLPGSGNTTGNYAYLEDVVRGHMLAMKTGKHGERYVLGGENMSYRELFLRAGGVAGCRYRLFRIPLPLMISAAWLMKQWAELTGRAPMITPGWVRKYSRNWSVTSEKAVKELGYEITPYEEGVKQIIKHFGLCR